MGRLERALVNRGGHAAGVAERTIARMRPLGPRAGARLLDVGCGTGEATSLVAAAFSLEAVGVDVDPGQIDVARERARPGLVFRVGDATA